MSVCPLLDRSRCPLTCVPRRSITAYCEEHLIDAEECVREMRETVHRETRLTVSAGIAPNKVRSRAPSPHRPPLISSPPPARARVSDARKGDSVRAQCAGAPPDVGPDLLRQGSYPPHSFPFPVRSGMNAR